ncbi:hypothetical protein AC578_10979 [Pseudocercospora eumusae]|uniref:TauD/TfdA-like domain-containing protein n=1 Tax=Pseudocercospora eumusae TaxID=321146 RepID=A0A139HS95_9PEZI|nr:hypothetical protein AC578_10979 [Pseudocercospora eumusae]
MHASRGIWLLLVSGQTLGSRLVELRIHPVSNSGKRLDGGDDETSAISSEQAKQPYADSFVGKKQSAKEGWHSDITFEPFPSVYAILRLTELPVLRSTTASRLLIGRWCQEQ